MNFAADQRYPYPVMYNNCGISRFDMPDEMAQFIYHQTKPTFTRRID